MLMKLTEVHALGTLTCICRTSVLTRTPGSLNGIQIELAYGQVLKDAKEKMNWRVSPPARVLVLLVLFLPLGVNYVFVTAKE